MKVGAEDRKKVIVMVAVMAIAVLLLVRAMFQGSSTAQADSITPVQEAPSAHVKNNGSLLSSEDPSLRLDLLAASEDLKYKGSGRDIFKSMPEPPPIPKPIAKPIGPQPPPPPPPIPLKFFGFASEPGEPKAVFLSQGDDIFVAHEGDIVDRHYKVAKIDPNSVTITDVLDNNTQQVALTQQP
jgi:hypothetical protein